MLGIEREPRADTTVRKGRGDFAHVEDLGHHQEHHETAISVEGSEPGRRGLWSLVHHAEPPWLFAAPRAQKAERGRSPAAARRQFGGLRKIRKHWSRQERCARGPGALRVRCFMESNRF